VRFLGLGDYCELSSLYLRLLAEGHEVKVHIAKPEARGTLDGLVRKTDNWEEELSWIGRDGIVLFENTAQRRGALQDLLRSEGFRVIGGSAFGDRLENDRAFAQAILKDLGFPVCPVREFFDRRDAIEFVQNRPRRYVLKFNNERVTFVGGLDDGRDICAYLAGLSDEDAGSFILMDFVHGIEMGVGAYFNGERFLKPSCLDWEHKRFFPGDLGELTGEMGTVVTYDRTATFHDQTLGRMQGLLGEAKYCGYVNLNTIVNEHGIWPLEFTCRFGYPGYAILDPLQDIAWGDLFGAMLDRSRDKFETKPGFAVGIVMTTPPFPYSRPGVDEPVGLPVMFDKDLAEDDLRHIHYGEVGLLQGQLVTSGANGWTMVVTGVGPTIRDAQQRANSLAARVFIPRVRYRRDIGDRLISGDYERVWELGFLDPANKAHVAIGSVR
jgi:phosphoribosylamine---glycine ligase